MFIDEFDNNYLEQLEKSYNDINEEIESLGVDEVKEHSPLLLTRRTLIANSIVSYAQHFIVGLANADNLKVEDIFVYLRDNNPKHIK